MSEAELSDAILRSALELQRLSAHEEAEALAILQQLEDELKALLNTRTLSAASRREVTELIRIADAAIIGRYEGVAAALDTHGLVLLVAERTVEAIEAGLGVSALTPTAETLASLARENLIEGSPAAKWWARQAEDTAFKFAAAVRQGVVNGETNERIVARIAGREGFMETTRRHTRALVHSSVMSAANQARLATYRKNGRFAAGVRWLSTLDSHVCTTCAALDGQAWDFDGKPIKGSDMLFQAPPAHMNCRCVLTLIPSVKVLRELDPQMADEIEQGRMRASKDGPVKNQNFDEFLSRQSPAFVENMLGKKRAEMYRAGSITLRDLVSGNGRALTLDELRTQ